MIEIRESEHITAWLAGLRDAVTRARIAARIQRLAFGHTGDVKPVGEGISDLRLQFGPGYRIYYLRRNEALILLLCGRDKSTQKKDIATSKRLAKDTV